MSQYSNTKVRVLEKLTKQEGKTGRPLEVHDLGPIADISAEPVTNFGNIGVGALHTFPLRRRLGHAAAGAGLRQDGKNKPT